ncbi:MAG: hypothetical protein WB586_06110 [Chthoniobacterales bacterium]
MDATANFSLRFARASESKVETTDWLLSRQVLQRIATRMSLVSEAIGFSVLGILIIVNRHQADLNGLSGGSSIAMVGGISAILVGTVFLVAACLHWRFCVKHSAELLVRRQYAQSNSRLKQLVSLAKSFLEILECMSVLAPSEV